MLIFAILIYAVIMAMQMSTNKFMEEIREAFLDSDRYVTESTFAETPKNYQEIGVNYVIQPDEMLLTDINMRFNQHRKRSRSEYKFEEIDIELEVVRKFTWHNFRKGYIWIEYTVFMTEPDGRRYGSKDIPVKIAIEWQEGKWVSTRIWENP